MKDHRNEKRIRRIESETFSRKNIGQKLNFSYNPKDYIGEDDLDLESEIDDIDNEGV